MVFLSRRCQNEENVHETFINTKIRFYKRTFLDHRVQNVAQVSSESLLPWLVQNRPSATILRVETSLNSSKDNFIAKSFRLSTKRKLSILLNFLFPFVSFIGVFSILKCKTLVLKTTTSWTRQPFCWWMTFTKVSNPFLPPPPKWLTWPLGVCGGVGYGWFYWFSLYWKNFFPNLSGVRNFFPDI